MTKNIIIAALGVVCMLCLWELHKDSVRASNRYEVILHQDNFDIKRGDSVISTLRWEEAPALDSVFQMDNL